MAAFPGGAVLVGDTANCTASRFEGSSKAAFWSIIVPQCDGVMETAVAPDSVSYVRGRSSLIAIGTDGNQRWKLAMDTEQLPADLLAPAVTLDSMVVIAAGARLVVAYRNDSAIAWRFSVAQDEVLAASPMGSRGEGVYVLTNRALYALGADGSLRFRRARTPASG
jgi:hypothetical protein